MSEAPKLPARSQTVWRAYNAIPEKERAYINWELVEQYLPLVRGIVARMGIYFNHHVDMDDIYSVGVSGLISAVHRYDTSKKRAFSAYASTRVKGAILDELRRMDWMPRALRASAKKLRRTVEKLEAKLKRAATEEEVSRELGLSKNEYTHLLDQVRPLSFVAMDDTSRKTDSEGGTLHEIISDANALNAREKAEDKEVVELMRARIDQLPDLQQRILKLYYFEGLRLAEIAQVFGLSEARICQIHTHIVLSLRAYLDGMHTRIVPLRKKSPIQK